MRRYRPALLVSVCVAALLSPANVAAAAAADLLYVDNTGSNCADAGTGSGTALQPFCTIGAAAAVVVPGQTVKITGFHSENVRFTRAGTPTAPIVFDGSGGGTDGQTVISGFNAAVVGFAGAHDVALTNVTVVASGLPGTPIEAVVVDGSDRVRLEHVDITGSTDPASGAALHVTGGSDDVVVSRSVIRQAAGPGVLVQGGAAPVVLNSVIRGGAQGIALDVAPGAVVAHNTIVRPCGRGITISGPAAGTQVLNNIVQAVADETVDATCRPVSDPAGLTADAAAASGVHADFNLVDAAAGVGYRWAGAAFTTAAAFAAGTGQGGHDLGGDADLGDDLVPRAGSPVVDSGLGSLSVLPATDHTGRPRVDDPTVPNTGSGGEAIVDRGAFELQDRLVAATMTVSDTQVPVGAAVAFAGTLTSGWSLPFTCTFDFGDGTAPAGGPCTTTHVFGTTGVYQVRITAGNAAKLSVDFTRQVTVVPSGVLRPTLALTGFGALGVDAVVTAGTGPWPIVTVVYDFGDGSPPVTSAATTMRHKYARPGRYTAKATVTDTRGTTRSAARAFTPAGAGFVPVGPARLLDTANGVGATAAIPARGQVLIRIGGAAGIPTGITAAAVQITAVAPATAGGLTAWPASGARPETASVRFAAGQTTSNQSFVKVAANGAIRLYNDSGSALHVTLDVVGYFATGGPGLLYEPDARHLADTRTGLGIGAGQVQPGTSRTLQVTGASGVPASAGAIALSVTTLGATAPGTLTIAGAAAVAYPAGQATSGFVVVPLTAAGAVTIGATGGAADVVVDLVGYFAATATTAFVPVDPIRTVAGQVLAAQATGRFDVTGAVPGLATAVAVTGAVTVTNPSAAGSLLVNDAPQLAWNPGRSPANAVVVRSATTPAFRNDSPAQITLAFDVTGFFG